MHAWWHGVPRAAVVRWALLWSEINEFWQPATTEHQPDFLIALTLAASGRSWGSPPVNVTSCVGGSMPNKTSSSICSKMLINAGIRAIKYKEGYADPMAEEMLAAAQVRLTQINEAKK